MFSEFSSALKENNKNDLLLIGFAAETSNHIEKAREKGVQSVAISSGEDELLGHWLEVKPDSPAVFICHGNGENVGDWLEAQLMLKYMGYSTFVFDYAGYGHSKGYPSVNNLNLNAHDAWCTFVN